MGARILNSKFLLLNSALAASFSVAACRGAVPASVHAQDEGGGSTRKKDPPAELKPLTNIFAPEVAAMWLVAYWMGRLQKVW